MLIWLASYPRSGNTLVRLILFHIFGQKTYSLYDDKRDLGRSVEIRETVGHEFLPEGWNQNDAHTADELWLVKTHNLPDDDRPAIYIIRDGRDVAVSYQKYLNDFSGENPELLDVISGFVPFGSWSDHIQNWRPKSRRNTLLLQYEEILSSPKSIISKLSSFLEKDPINGELPAFKDLQTLDPRFFRKGMINDWKNSFSYEHEILFWGLHKEVMLEYGYDSDRIMRPESSREPEDQKLLEVSTNLLNRIKSRVNYTEAVLAEVRDDQRNQELDFIRELEEIRKDRNNKGVVINKLLSDLEEIREDRSMKEAVVSKLSRELEEIREDRSIKEDIISKLVQELEETRTDQSLKEVALRRLIEENKQQRTRIEVILERVNESRKRLALKHAAQMEIVHELLHMRSKFSGLIGDLVDIFRKNRRKSALRRIDIQQYDIARIDAQKRSMKSSPLSIGLDLLQIQAGISGGVEVYADTLIRALQNHPSGIRLSLLISDDQYKKYADFEANNIHLRVIGKSRNMLNTLRKKRDERNGLVIPWSNYVDLTFSNLHNEFDVNILHSPVQIFSRLDFGIPSILHVHDMQHKHFPEYFSSGDLQAREILYYASGVLSSAVVVSSEFAKEDILKYLDIPGTKIFVIPVAANPDVVNNDCFVSANEARELFGLPELFGFYPAQFWKHKNHLKLIEALAIIRTERPELDLNLVFTGNTKMKEWISVREHIERIGLVQNIHVLGHIPPSHLGGVYRAASFCIVPSLFEASSYPLIEAQMLGCPTLSSDVTSLPELMADGSGVLFDPHSSEDIAHKVIRLLDNPESMRLLQEKGKVRANRENNIENYANRIVDLYQNIAAEET